MYRVDALDLFRGALSTRRMVLLLRALPESSNVRQHMDAAVENEQNRQVIAELKKRRATRG